MSNVRPQVSASIPPALREFWDVFTAELGKDLSAQFYEAFHFADNEAAADSLSKLVLAGAKHATAGLVWSFERACEALPGLASSASLQTGVASRNGIIETIAVAVVPFREVTAEFASVEGEGDGSLEYWQREHWEYFSRECARIGREPRQTMPVVCERFKVVHRANHAA